MDTRETINWDVSQEDHELIVQIAKRIERSPHWPEDRRTTIMDLVACHANGTPLDLEGLLAGPEQDFSHDLYGIRQHINRSTGKLEDFFTPRYVKR